MTQAKHSFTRRTALRMLIGAGAYLALPHTRVFGDTEDDLRQQAEKTQVEIDATQQQYNDAKVRLDALAAEYQAVAIEQAKTLDQIYEVEEEIRNISAEIDATQAEIEKREAELAEKQERLAKRISSSYKSGGTDFLSVLLSSATFDDLISNIYYLDKITESDERLIAEVREAREQLAAKKASLEADQAALEEKRAELEELNAQLQLQLQELQGKQAEMSDIIASLDEKVRALIAERDETLLAAEREAQRKREEEERARKEAEAAAAAAAAAEEAAAASSYGYTVTPHADISNLVQGATGSQAAVIAATYSVPSPGAGLCAWWVSDVFDTAGIGSWGGNACDMYYEWCYSSNRSEIQPGMIIAVSTWPSSGLGAIYGHVGVYIGDGIIRENIGYINTNTLDNWIASYGTAVTVRWGWMGGVKLA